MQASDLLAVQGAAHPMPSGHALAGLISTRRQRKRMVSQLDSDSLKHLVSVAVAVPIMVYSEQGRDGATPLRLELWLGKHSA